MVQLKLDAIEQNSLPEDCYISVRVGEMQKISKVSAKRTYRFPQAGDRRYGKLEVFRRIGCCSLDVDPSNKAVREVSVSCSDAVSGGISGSLGFRIAVEAEQPPAPAPVTVHDDVEAAHEEKVKGKLRSAKDYLSKHSLEVRLSEAMQAVLRERPEDPSEFIAARLLGSSHGSSGGLKLPPVSRTPLRDQTASAPMPTGKRPMAEPADKDSPAAHFRQQPRPRELEPLDKAKVGSIPAKAQLLVDTLPFEQYYRLHFQSIGIRAFAAIHKSFPRRAPIPPQPLRSQEDGPKLSEDEAAMRIQAMRRGKVAREAIQKEASGAPNEVATSPAQEAPCQAHEAREEAAATRIQAIHRGNAARQALQKEPAAASTVVHMEPSSPSSPAAALVLDVVRAPQAQTLLPVSALTVLGPAFGSFNMPTTFLLI